MKKLLLFLMLFCAVSARAQLGSVGGGLSSPTLILTSDPTGSCPNGRLAVNITTQTLFYCANSVWNSTVGGGGTGTVFVAQLPDFVTGTSGTDFNIVKDITSVLFNLPDASCTIRGVVNNTAQIFCGNKTLQGDTVLDGDTYVTGNLSTDHPIEITINDACVASEANVALLCVNPDDNKLYFSADGSDPVELGAGGGTTTTIIGNGLTNGGGVTWTGDLDFTVAAAEYIIAGNSYSSDQTDITLDAADGANPRIDAIIVKDDGTVDFITGTPAATPALPSVDATSELLLTFVYVDTGATVPSNFTNVDLYLENTEWTCAASANFACNSTSNPYAGSLDVKGTTAVATNNFTLTKPAAGTENLANYSTLSFRTRTDATWPGPKSIVITALNGTTQVGVPVTLDTGTFGFNASTLSTYQLVVIPVNLFNTGSSLITTFKFAVAGGGSSLTAIYFDNVKLQGGANLDISPTVRFADGIVPTGAINGANQAFVLPQVPNPTTSLKCFGNGLRFKLTDDYTFNATTATITTVGTFQNGDTGLVCDYRY